MGETVIPVGESDSPSGPPQAPSDVSGADDTTQQTPVISIDEGSSASIPKLSLSMVEEVVNEEELENWFPTDELKGSPETPRKSSLLLDNGTLLFRPESLSPSRDDDEWEQPLSKSMSAMHSHQSKGRRGTQFSVVEPISGQSVLFDRIKERPMTSGARLRPRTPNARSPTRPGTPGASKRATMSRLAVQVAKLKQEVPFASVLPRGPAYGDKRTSLVV